MEEKYFIPELEDIRVGYQGEYHHISMDEAGDPELNYDRWETAILTNTQVQSLLKYGIRGFRVPYLTVDQIVAEGWKNYSIYTYEIPKTDWHLMFDPEALYVEIGKHDYDLGYQGIVKDINTLRYIQKLLGIK